MSLKRDSFRKDFGEKDKMLVINIFYFPFEQNLSSCMGSPFCIKELIHFEKKKSSVMMEI